MRAQIGKLVKIIVETEEERNGVEFLRNMFFFFIVFKVPAVQKADKANHFINPYPMDNELVPLTLIYGIVIFLLDSTIQHLSNRGQMTKI